MNYFQSWGIGFILTLSLSLSAQQVPDTGYVAHWDHPPYELGAGPVVGVDGAHNNFHKLNGGFRAFGNVAQAGGFQVVSVDESFTPESLANIDILVIANPLHASNLGNWQLPCPSAFSAFEIQTVDNWVRNGGRLILIADHMPFGGAAYDLGKNFGIEWENGFASVESGGFGDLFTTSFAPFTNADSIRSIRTFTGSAMSSDRMDVYPIIILQEGTLNLPTIAWNFDSLNTAMPLDGYYQGCWTRAEKGIVVCLGEAAGLTSQLVGPEEYPVGISTPRVGGNLGFIQDMLVSLAPENDDFMEALGWLRFMERTSIVGDVPFRYQVFDWDRNEDGHILISGEVVGSILSSEENEEDYFVVEVGPLDSDSPQYNDRYARWKNVSGFTYSKEPVIFPD
ncbi:MAG: hypothetical protein HWE14_14585 [Flavobacteriia bacterium]|nr:hypothetical protein [Flavobacteriia bacterium]